MTYTIISARDSEQLEKRMLQYDIEQLGTMVVLNSMFYQSFIGKLKETTVTNKPEVTKETKVTKSEPKETKVTKSKPKVTKTTKKVKSKPKVTKETKVTKSK